MSARRYPAFVDDAAPSEVGPRGTAVPPPHRVAHDELEREARANGLLPKPFG